MGNYFPTSARYAKAQEFLELKRGTMKVLEYVAKFTELARFADDYVATDMAKVRKFKDGVTPRPKRVYGTCNRRGAYVHQKTFLIISVPL